MASKKNILVAAAIIIIIAAGYFYREYNRKPADVIDAAPAYKIEAAKMVELYETDEPEANRQWLGKIVQVAGSITEINNQQDTLINIILGESNAMHKVSCLLDKRHITEIEKCAVGQQISIKGICTGFLLDVELNRCVIVDNY